MKHKIIIIAVLLFTNLACAKSDKDVFNLLKDSTFKIIFNDGSSCTAFNAKVEGEVRTVTAGHCCDKVENEHLLKFSLNPDICVFKKIVFKTKKHLKVAKREPKFADELFTLGFPSGFGPLMHKGYIIVPSEFRTEVMMQILPGQSGSAVVNKNGRLIGVVSMYNPYIPQHGILTPYKLLKEYLK